MACFDGEISKESVTPIDAWLSRVSPGTHPLLLVRSRGGDAEAGIGIMEDLQAADAEVRVVDFCASSCADYFFAGAKHRSVTDGAVILFHGGYSPEARGHLLETLEKFKESGKAPGTDWAKARTSALADFDRVMALQDELYARVGVSNEIVRGMDKLDIDSLRESDCDSTRSAERKAVFFTPAQLQRMGIRIEQGKEVAEPGEVNRKLREMGSSSEACLAPASYFRSNAPAKD